MNENIIKQPPLPNAIQFHTRQNDDMTEVMRITRDGVWVNPDMQVDETAKAVLDALSSQVQVLVQRAVEDKREWVGLTDEESKPLIQKAMMYYGHNPDHWTLTAGAGFCIFARAIEAKLKEKNT